MFVIPSDAEHFAFVGSPLHSTAIENPINETRKQHLLDLLSFSGRLQ
jgi:hypothetical protein